MARAEAWSQKAQAAGDSGDERLPPTATGYTPAPVLRSISSRWTLAVLLSVVMPFGAFALWVDRYVSQSLADDSVRFHLLSTAADLVGQFETERAERWQDLEQLAAVPLLAWFLSGAEDERMVFEESVRDMFDRVVSQGVAQELVFTVDREGRVGLTDRGLEAGDAAQELRARLWGLDLSQEEWFERALWTGRADLGIATVGEHLGIEASSEPLLGMAVRVISGRAEDTPLGVLVSLQRTDRLQERVASFGVKRLDSQAGRPGEDLYGTSYAWVWGPDADTIVAHPTRDLIGRRVSTLEAGTLRPLVDAARRAPWGMYPDYTFRGVEKKAAFQRMESTGWTIGVGVDFSDIYAPVDAASRTLLYAAGLALLLGVLLTVIVARRTVRPILALEEHTRRLAGGDLTSRLGWTRGDELGDLARGFDRMTADLEVSREQAAKAEKDAAWREMARQVAHEIKNPLTPIALSVSLLRRAKADKSPEVDEIEARTLDLIERQVQAMRLIAQDFHSFAGHHREKRPVDVGEVLDEVLALHAAWAKDLGVTIERQGEGGVVLADRAELHRALVNLVSNALEASPDGGTLEAHCRPAPAGVELLLRDCGTGLDAAVEGHLFEPYFTTRTSGTGLGLAIVRRIVEDLGGRVTIENRTDRRGALVRLVLPRHLEKPT